MSSIATSALIMIALFALLLLVRRDMAPRVVLSLSVLLLLQAVGESEACRFLWLQLSNN
jgi:hypothetical protein